MRSGLTESRFSVVAAAFDKAGMGAGRESDEGRGLTCFHSLWNDAGGVGSGGPAIDVVKNEGWEVLRRSEFRFKIDFLHRCLHGGRGHAGIDLGVQKTDDMRRRSNRKSTRLNSSHMS